VFVFEFLLAISEIILVFNVASEINTVPLLDAIQLLILFEGTVEYLEPKLLFFLLA
jgi:hypothetical protein